jgi:hypothetical protein
LLAFASADPKRRWPCDAEHDWTLKDASRAAASALYVVGEPAITTRDAAEEAFARWYSLWGSEEGRALSLRAIKAAIFGPPADHFAFAFDDPARGWGRGVWKPTPDDIRRLNTWIEGVVAALNATLGPCASDEGARADNATSIQSSAAGWIDNPANNPEPAMSAEGAVEEPNPEPKLVRTKEEAGVAYLERLENERASGRLSSRREDEKWGQAQRPFRVTQALIRYFRSEHRTDKEKRVPE